jgi:hypothetical protein
LVKFGQCLPRPGNYALEVGQRGHAGGRPEHEPEPEDGLHLLFLPDHSAGSYRVAIRFYEDRRAERRVDRERQDRAVSPTRSEWGCGGLRSLPLAANRRYS